MSDTTHKGRILLIAMGNPNRGDDALGPYLGMKLRKTLPELVVFCNYDGDGAGLMAQWHLKDWVYIIDAVASGQEHGTQYILDAHEKPLQSQFFHYSSHAFGLSEGVEMARVLDRLPERLVIFGIEGKDYSHGHEMTEVVRLASEQLEVEIQKTLQQAVEEHEQLYA